MEIRRTAWVPEDPEQDLNEAAASAVRWIEDRCREEKATAILVVKALGVADGVPALRSFKVTSPQSRGRVQRGRPVLAYLPDAKSLSLAEDLARGSSLVVIEGFTFSVDGWAHMHGATNLAHPDQPSSAPDKRWLDAVDRLAFHKNNGYGDAVGTQVAQQVVSELRAAGLLDRDELVSALAAKNVSPQALKKLGRIIDRA